MKLDEKSILLCIKGLERISKELYEAQQKRDDFEIGHATGVLRANLRILSNELEVHVDAKENKSQCS